MPNELEQELSSEPVDNPEELASNGEASQPRPQSRQNEIAEYREWKTGIRGNLSETFREVGDTIYQKAQLEQPLWIHSAAVHNAQNKFQQAQAIHQSNLQELTHLETHLKSIPRLAFWRQSERQELSDQIKTLRAKVSASQSGLSTVQQELNNLEARLAEENQKLSIVERQKQQLELDYKQLQEKYREKDQEFYRPTVERWLHPESLTEEEMLDCFREDGMVAIHRSIDAEAVCEAGYLCPGLILEMREYKADKFVDYRGQREVGFRLHFGLNSVFSGRSLFLFPPGTLLTHRGHGGVGSLKKVDTHFSIQGHGPANDPSHELPIDWGFVLLPEDEQIPWENFFDRIGKRPKHLYYYSAKSGEEALAEWRNRFNIPTDPDVDALKDAFFAYFDQVEIPPTNSQPNYDPQTIPTLGSCYASKLREGIALS